MAARPELVVTLDGRVLRSDEPLVRADDPLFAAGDGVFETVLIRGGAACLLDAHLRRLAQSAALLELPPPDLAAFADAVRTAADAWVTAEEGVVRMVHGRGPAAFVTASPVPHRITTARRDGIAVVTVTRRAADTPWSPLRAKSSSYAFHLAALRHAALAGADDAVFVDAHGTVHEGPRSAVVIEAAGTLLTPPTSLPILAGTTVAASFAAARLRGVPCREERLTADDLLAAQGVWLLSAVTLAARVHTLDGVALAASNRIDLPALVDAAVG